MLMAIDGRLINERWPPMTAEPRQTRDEAMDLAQLGALRRGETDDANGEAAVVGTPAIAFRAMGEGADIAEAEARANTPATVAWTLID
jgi:hypothetical protein